MKSPPAFPLYRVRSIHRVRRARTRSVYVLLLVLLLYGAARLSWKRRHTITRRVVYEMMTSTGGGYDPNSAAKSVCVQ